MELKKVIALEAYQASTLLLSSLYRLRTVPEDWHHVFGPVLPSLLPQAIRWWSVPSQAPQVTDCF